MTNESNIDDWRKYGCEFVGTFALVFFASGAIMVGSITGAIGSIGSGIASGTIVTIVIYTFGNISGAHVNPALSIAALVVGKLQRRLLPGYIISQMVGSALAAYLLLWVVGDYVKIGANIPNFELGVTPVRAFVIELVMSVLLMWVICGSAFHASAFNKFAGIAIGATVGLEVLVMGAYSGAAMNPARAFGPYLASGDFDFYWIYLFGPIIGMLLGAYLYLFSHGNRHDN
jgi:MIP family channel proteins